MKIKITFRNMEHSKVIEEYAYGQLAKIIKFLDTERSPVFIDLVLEPSKLREHGRAEIRVKTPNYDLISNYEHSGEKFYDVLDRVIDVMYHELREEKKKRSDMLKMRGRHDEFKKQR